MILYKLMQKDEQGNFTPVLDRNNLHIICAQQHLNGQVEFREQISKQIGTECYWQLIENNK